MKVAIIGYGNMGKQVCAVAKFRGHDLVAVIDSSSPEASANELTKSSLNGAELAIEFTSPQSVISNIKKLCSFGVSTVVGSTGWYDQMSEVKSIVEASGTGLIWSPTFSIGVNLYYKVVEAAAQMFDKFEDYDVWGHEIHHFNKVDSPSGGAKILEKIILDNIKRKNVVIEDRVNRKIEPNEFHFSSTRGGSVNFAHTIAFDSSADTVTLTHSSRNRDAYALGAVKAAEWLVNKKGFYNMEDFLEL